ncbi:hypothetical protein Tco_1487426, partial [Tanacetum coccineum]
GSPKLMETKVPKFLAKYGEGSGKIYKTSGSSSINTESGEASIKLNVDVGDDEEDEGALGSSSTNDKALARLMVSEMAMHTKRAIEMQKEERKAFLEIKIFDNQSIERDRLIGIGFVLDFVEFISFTFGDKEMISVIEAVSR